MSKNKTTFLSWPNLRGIPYGNIRSLKIVLVLAAFPVPWIWSPLWTWRCEVVEGSRLLLTVRHPMRLCSKGRWKARGSPHQSSSSVAAVWKFAGFCKCCMGKNTIRNLLGWEKKPNVLHIRHINGGEICRMSIALKETQFGTMVGTYKMITQLFLYFLFNAVP